MADRLLGEAIQSVVFDRLREIFNDKIQVIPNARFIEDLFAHGSPPQHPRSIYDTTQCILVDNFKPNRLLGMEMALEAHECVGVGVAVQIAKVVSSTSKISI